MSMGLPPSIPQLNGILSAHLIALGALSLPPTGCGFGLGRHCAGTAAHCKSVVGTKTWTAFGNIDVRVAKHRAHARAQALVRAGKAAMRSHAGLHGFIPFRQHWNTCALIILCTCWVWHVRIQCTCLWVYAMFPVRRQQTSSQHCILCLALLLI